MSLNPDKVNEVTNSLPVLYSFRRCPYAIRARLALRYAGVQCELREVDLKHKPAQMLAASPKGSVPVLVIWAATGTEEVIEESLDIMLWALAQSDPDGWLAINRRDAGDLIDANDNKFKHWLDRYKYPNYHDDIIAGEPLSHCERFLAELEQRLEKHAFLCGNAMSIADVALYSFVRQFAFVDRDWFKASAYPGTIHWLDSFLAGDLFDSVMGKYPTWQRGDVATVF